MTRRLFLFAAYDRDRIIDNSLLWYLQSLSHLGDIVFVMDNDAPDFEIDKVKQIPNVLYASATRHGEYDFGSYKRAYTWARDNNLLKKYDWVYLVNDSVYGPFSSLEPMLLRMESAGADLTGMAEYSDRTTPSHVQSWFVGLGKSIVKTDLLDKFMNGVSREKSKAAIIRKYEVGLSCTFLRAGFKMFTLMENNSDTTHVLYDTPLTALNMGIPFIKKRAISSIPQFCYLYSYADDGVVLDAVLDNANRVGIFVPHTTKKYARVYRLSVFGIPLITIFKNIKHPQYKVCLFDIVPLIKFTFHGNWEKK